MPTKQDKSNGADQDGEPGPAGGQYRGKEGGQPDEEKANPVKRDDQNEREPDTGHQRTVPHQDGE